MTGDSRAAMAAANNAHLYQAMFESHGLRYDRLPYAFVGLDQPPPYHSNLVILSQGRTGVVRARLRALARAFDGVVGYKDSFSELDLRANGFELLFEASWLYRRAAHHSLPDGWARIESASSLKCWELALKAAGSPAPERLFPDSLLGRPDIIFLGRRTANGAYSAGCIANISGDCAGISNVFGATHENVFEPAADAVSASVPELPIVGYATGSLLKAALRTDFVPTGKLRVFASQAASF